MLLIFVLAGIGMFIFTDLLKQKPPNDQNANLGSAKTSRISPEVAKWLEALRTAQPDGSDDGAGNDISRQAGFLEPDGPKIPKDFMGQPLMYVEWYLAEHGIKYQTILFGPTFDQPPFKVFKMEPRPGQYVTPGTTVTVYAYQNPQFRQTKWQQKVPSVAGLPLDEAEKLLRKLGFLTVLISVPTAEPAMDKVVRSQSLRPGAMAWPTTQINLQVNRLVKRPKAENATVHSGQ
ncbi:MAG: PASTA domain-containing protein [Pseudomonadota bacterium]